MVLNPSIPDDLYPEHEPIFPI